MLRAYRFLKALTAGLLALCVLAGIAYAAKSDDIQDEIDDLEAESESLAAERERIEGEIEETNDEMLDIAGEKAQIDKEIGILEREIANLNEQIHQYSLLIAERQAELDTILAEQNELFHRYQTRMRAIQEHGEISYLSVLLNADSFADMLNYRVMVNEISEADRKMMDDLSTMALQVLQAKEALDNERGKLEDKRRELSESETLLREKRAQSDELLATLYRMCADLEDDAERYEALENEMSAQIAEKEQELTEAKREEYLAWLAQQNRNDNDNTGDNTDNNGVDSSEVFFLYPLAYYGVVTSAYGYRYHPITGNYSFHTGVDIGVAEGTAIYASRSGYVSEATYSYAFGYYVTINHMDGYSTLYGHMTHYIVSPGDYVTQGQVIGYVGATGVYCTGPHLHFTIYYNGSTVNPMDYIG